MAISKRTRWEVLERDRFTCCYCGREAPDVLLEVDHVVPRSAGGGDEMSNLRTACESCNDGKAAKMPPRWLVAAAKKAQQAWLKNGHRHPDEDDLSDMYAYMAAYDHLKEFPAGQVLACITHVIGKAFPYRPTGEEIVLAAAVEADAGYGAPLPEGMPF